MRSASYLYYALVYLIPVNGKGAVKVISVHLAVHYFEIVVILQISMLAIIPYNLTFEFAFD